MPDQQDSSIESIWRSLGPQQQQEVVNLFRQTIKEMIHEHFRFSSATPSITTSQNLYSPIEPKQVVTNLESQRMQYALRDRAIALGWDDSEIDIIDCDLGRSGATIDGREGFKQLVADTNGTAEALAGLVRAV